MLFDKPVLLAINDDGCVHTTFKAEVNGKTLFITFEFVRGNYPPATMLVYESEKEFEEIKKNLEHNGWEIVEE